MFKIFRIICCITVILDSGHSLSAEWTQYSDSASIPMSKVYRDSIRARLKAIDISALNETERQNVARLLSLLDHESVDGQGTSSSGFLLQVTLFAVAVGVGAWYIYRRFSARIILSDDSVLRRMREEKYK